MKENRQQIENAIHQLEGLLEEGKYEEDFQKWFENNPIVFTALNFDNHISQAYLPDFEGRGDFPDFIVKEIRGIWEIFEIKTANEKLYLNDSKHPRLTSKIYSYLSQCRDYKEYFKDSTNREKFYRKHEISIKNEPNAKLVVGRKNNLEYYKLINDTFNGIEIITYDDIYNALLFFKSKILNEYEGMNGLTIALSAKFSNIQKNNYLLTFGSSKVLNFISFYLDTEQNLSLKLVDKNRMCKVETPDELNFKKLENWNLFLIEMAFGPDYTVLSIELNDQYINVNQFGKLNFDFKNLQENIVLGSNQFGTGLSKFQMTEMILWDKTFYLNNKIKLKNDCFENVLKNYELLDQGIFFTDYSFFYSNGHKNFIEDENLEFKDLVQKEKEKQPFYYPKNSNTKTFLKSLKDQS